jgi:hypothetical protein
VASKMSFFQCHVHVLIILFYLSCWRCFSTRKFGALLAPALLFNPVIWRAAGPSVAFQPGDLARCWPPRCTAV